MNKLSKQQRDQLIGIAVGTVAVIALLWFFGVTAKSQELSKTERDNAQMMDTLRRAEGTMKQSDEVAERLEARKQLLDRQEAMLAPEREGYSWVIVTMDDIIKAHKGVNIFKFNPPEITEIGMFYSFPYKWATFRLGGTGYYHDIGKFLADLENNYPYFKVQNLSVNLSGTAGTEPEKLDVSFELVVPIRNGEAK